MRVYIAKDGGQSGPYEPAEVVKGLETGTFNGSDFAHTEYSADWVPLSVLISVSPPPPPPPPIVSEGTGHVPDSDLLGLAYRQKAFVWLVLATPCLIPLAIVSGTVSLYGMIAISALSVVFAYKHAIARRSITAWLEITVAATPLVGPVLLWDATTHALKRAGIRVGPFGASRHELDRFIASQSTSVHRSRGSAIAEPVRPFLESGRVARSRSKKRRAAVWTCLVALGVSISAVRSLNRKPVPPQIDASLPSNTESGLTLGSLRLSAQTVNGHFREEDVLEDDEMQWGGSAAVISRDGNKLYLVSNSHVLGLRELALSDDSKDNSPEVAAYSLSVAFPSGKEVSVARFGDQEGALDLSLLEVDGTGLTEGIDYVTVPYQSDLEVRVGDEAVAVGSPRGLDGSHTFGRISAIRVLDQGEPYQVLQTDAAINPGNSGGPLFVKRRDRFLWVGVNTFMIDGNNLGFAIGARHVWSSKYRWYPATPQGAASAISQQYRRNATAK